MSNCPHCGYNTYRNGICASCGYGAQAPILKKDAAQVTQYTTVSQPVTITISKEWADFLTRAQTARNEWNKWHMVDHIAIIDWRNLELKVIKQE